ncbi:MAG: YdiU family protein [Gammaproteobacteria bacterium]|nr:YdiU family protein [Gammaproteobacteria bacterium]
MSAPITFDNSYAQLPANFYTRQALQPVTQPTLIKTNLDLAEQLGVDRTWLLSKDATQVFAGNELLPGADPLATVYAGFQFGNWNPQLGDGRALLLGEVLSNTGQRFDLQLKGSGPTHYSRGGDGRSPLGPVLREYLVSEAMNALGVPTTRALAAVATGDMVYREQPEPGGVLTRVASSHIRFGSFQYFSGGQDPASLRRLADYTIDRHYPDLRASERPYLGLLEQVIEQVARLIAKWQSIGFIHGVMNTDNMLITGETIDYGPCAFMDTFKQATVYSAIDQQGRYAYQNQPAIAHWNLMTLAQALLPLLHDNQDAAVEQAKATLQTFPDRFDDHYNAHSAVKLGLTPSKVSRALFAEFLALLETHELDFTNSFSGLAGRLESNAPLLATDDWQQWMAQWQTALQDNDDKPAARHRMEQANPYVIPRNHLIEHAIQQAYSEEGLDQFDALLQAVTDPFDPGLARSRFAQAPAHDEIVKRTFCGT